MDDYKWQEDLTWDEKFEIFKKFIIKEDRMPNRKNVGLEFSLYNWVQAQKNQRTKDRTKIEKIINFSNEFNVKLISRNRKEWTNNYNELESYLKEFSKLPDTGQKVNGINLRSWINVQFSTNQPDITKREKIENLLTSFNIQRDIVDLWEIYFEHLELFLKHKIPTRYSKNEKFKEWVRDIKRRWKHSMNGISGGLIQDKIDKLKAIDYEHLIFNEMIDYENLNEFITNEKNLENLEILRKNKNDEDDDGDEDIEENDENLDINNMYDDIIDFDNFYNYYKVEYFKDKRMFNFIKKEQQKYLSGLIIDPFKLKTISFFKNYNFSLNKSQKIIKEKITTVLNIKFLYNENIDIIKKLFQEAIEITYNINQNKNLFFLKDIFNKNQSEIGTSMGVSRERARQLLNVVLVEFEKILVDKKDLFITLKNSNQISNIKLIEEINNEKDNSIMYNTIFYGPTGTGKSYMIEAKNFKKSFRCMFHEEYSYFDFIGQYKPVMYTIDKNSKNTLYDELNNPISNDKEPIIVYKFIPGDFMKSYVEAYKKPNEQVVLIIEEINRGNSSSIFGNIFQLLDRDEKGESKYPVTTSTELSKYLKDNQIENHFELKLPKNFLIIATMNTSDQSLFFMDSAFKRRWNLKYIPINYEDEKLIGIEIEGTNYNWLNFIKKINKLITEKLESENKCIGQWFIKPINNVIKEEDLKNKLLHYLFFDVFHHDRLAIFKTVEFTTIYNKNTQDFIDELFTI